jgi:hypothetical protein
MNAEGASFGNQDLFNKPPPEEVRRSSNIPSYDD